MKNDTGITGIRINFDLGVLYRALLADDEFLWNIAGDKIKPDIYKGIAKGARARILKGDLRKLKKNTVKIRQKEGKMPPVPLFRTGKMQKSIQGRKDGVYVENYGIDHLEGYTIKAGSNEFTKHWKRDVYVPPRNYLPNSETIEISPQSSIHLYKEINRLIKKRGR
tara:strand:+ start:221 stop:718 length:498 start_codon:yes stop_codon:yes gene_type:complete